MAERAIEEIQKKKAAGYRNHGLAVVFHILGKKKEPDDAMTRLLQETEQWGIQFAPAHAVRDETDEAFRWLERSYELQDSGIVMLKVNWALQGLHADPPRD